MAMTSNSVVGVFHDHAAAQRAVHDLKRAGFTDNQIGILGRDSSNISKSGSSGTSGSGDADETDSYAAEGAATGVAAGAGVGALWGLGIIAGILSPIGPAIAAGSLAAVLTSAAAGAAAAGLAGSLVGMGIPKDEAEYYENEVHSGRIIITVTASGREDEARSILRRHGGYDRSSAGSMSNQGTMEGSTRSTAGSAMHGATAAMSNAADTLTGGSNTRNETTGTHAMGAHSTGTHAAGGQTVRAVEERLDVHKTAVQTGEVNIRKEVHTEKKTIEVPVTKEEVVIERRNTAGQTASAADIGGGRQEIRIPVTEEQVHVEKTPVVKEEISVSKRKVQGTERVSETVRSEDIKVEGENGGSCNTRNS